MLTDDTSRLQKLLADHGDELFSEHALTFTRKPVITKDTRSAAEANRQEREARPASAAADKDRDRRNRNATRGLPPDKEKAEAIRKLGFLTGTWESVEPDHAPPAPETRMVMAEPDGLSLIVTTESVLGTGRPVHVSLFRFVGLAISSDSPKTLIATVFGKPLYLEDLTPAEAEVKRKELPQAEFDEWLRGYRGARTYENVCAAVTQKYIDREKLGVTKKEFAAIAASVERQLKPVAELPEGTTITPEERKGIMIAWGRASLMDWKFHHAEMEKAFRQQTGKTNFADTYPTGERLKWLLATPPYMWDQPSADRKAGSSQTFGGKSLDRKLYKRKEGAT